MIHLNYYREILEGRASVCSSKMKRSLVKANKILENESHLYRPTSSDGKPGSLLLLNPTIPTILVPDLHARLGFLLEILEYRPDDGDTILELLKKKAIQLVCVGDGVHSEYKTSDRWKHALMEFQEGYRDHRLMDQEVTESFSSMQLVMELKVAFPMHFHFLKGNHENITNEEGEGNHPFGKYAFEGEMFFQYVAKFWGIPFLEKYSLFEKNLPLLAIGRNFLVSHAEPARAYSKEELIDGSLSSEVVHGLTWTRNGDSIDGSVSQMLDDLIEKKDFGQNGEKDDDSGSCQKNLYFAGHRIVSTAFNLRAGGLFVQFHNSARYNLAVIPIEGSLNPSDIIRDIQKKRED